jgi:4-hydroxy-tetrahydrodipicolinate reductase
MKIALLGYGKMGKEIEKIAVSRSHSISLIIDENNPTELNSENLKKIDVAIDFSAPNIAYTNILTCINNGTPVVSGTTGWLDKYDEICEMVVKNNSAFFYASNYSIGVNVFFYINKQLAKIMNNYPEFEVDIVETHHTQKLDAPSGTAITAAEGILSEITRKSAWELNEQSAADNIKIEAIRIPDVPGIHEVNYNSEIDHIQIKHSAKSRKGFATGAVMAAEYIANKKGVFGMSDLLGF